MVSPSDHETNGYHQEACHNYPSVGTLVEVEERSGVGVQSAPTALITSFFEANIRKFGGTIFSPTEP